MAPERQVLAAASGQTVPALPDSRAAARARVASYLQLRRTRTILGSFLISSVLLVALSEIDIYVSRVFFEHGFDSARLGWTRLLRDGVHWFVILSMVAVVGIHVFNRLSGRNLCGIDGRTVVYLVLVLALGAGLIVNAALKHGFERPRPRDIVEFGGSEPFIPAFVVAPPAGARHRSFSSGDTAGAFLSLAFIFASRRKRMSSMIGIGFAVAYGGLVSASRIASGAHFFSDTVVSFFVMLIVADALHYYMFGPRPAFIGKASAPHAGMSGVRQRHGTAKTWAQ
jgi:lipid A 4'-phosphatase